MLRALQIENYALIRSLEIAFDKGFTVITGETGAGKSILMGALSLILGSRAETDVLHDKTRKCIVEGVFDIEELSLQNFFEENDLDYQPLTTLRREINEHGKSRAFINDTPVNLTTLRTLASSLIDIHSQHQNLLLNKQDFQLSVVDIIAQNQGLLAEYQEVYGQLQTANRELQELKDDIEKNRQQVDFMQFQYEELQQANLVDGEQEELEQQSDMLSHAEDIKGALYEADGHLNGDQQGAVDNVRQSYQTLRNIARVLPAASELAERLESCHIELKDIADEVGSLLERTDFDP
ncbi:MAG: AAA family ATPase, partial [Bacteroidales bacterium]|nr:AAA family ATPase [Bacteroidales bacterium]